ncbi:MAG: alpha/beta hydrolase [Actinobacteria bacterium]|nr:alpha/beta hydrolase [Actinomycetota bacterium]
MDIRFNYHEKGSGAPLVLLHGNNEDSRYFEHQIEELSAFFRVITPDTRGHGKTPRGLMPFTLSQFADDLDGFLHEIGVEKTHLLGFSDGGNIALLFALKHPEKIDRLILNGADLHPSGVKLSTQLPICIAYGFASLLASFSRKALERKEMLGLMVREPDIQPSELKNLTMPVLVIAGGHDMIKEDHTRLIASAIPNSELCFLPGGHFIARDNSKTFNERVIEFLRSSIQPPD